MDDNSITGVLKSLGLDKWIPAALAFHAFASALDAAIPQPAPGSNWLPWRKLLSIIALNFANAKNISQPDVTTWLQRIVVGLASTTPPPGPKPTIRQRIVLGLASLVPEPSSQTAVDQPPQPTGTTP